MVILQYINHKTMEKWEHIGVFETEELMRKNMGDFAEKCEYKIPYWRLNELDDGWKHLDIGGHVQFYKYVEVKELLVNYETVDVHEQYNTVTCCLTYITKDDKLRLLGIGCGNNDDAAYNDALMKIN